MARNTAANIVANATPANEEVLSTFRQLMLIMTNLRNERTVTNAAAREAATKLRAFRRKTFTFALLNGVMPDYIEAVGGLNAEEREYLA